METGPYWSAYLAATLNDTQQSQDKPKTSGSEFVGTYLFEILTGWLFSVNWKEIFSLALDCVIFLIVALAPAIPYIKQYSIIKQRRDVGAFSSYVCAILLYGQSLRILFWLSKQFQSALLFQSLFMIVIQLYLLKACVECQGSEVLPGSDIKQGAKTTESNIWLSRFETGEFLAMEYLQILRGLLSVLDGSFYCVLLFFRLSHSCRTDWSTLSNTRRIGRCSPSYQKLPKAQRQKLEVNAVLTSSLTMISLWFLGDFARLVYYLWASLPVQFIVGGSMAILMDAIVLLQFYTLRHKDDGIEESKSGFGSQDTEEEDLQ